jgi:hypothetical protein
MARGAQGTAQKMASSGFAGANAFNTGLEASNTALQNYLLPQYQNLIQNPGYDQATKNAITLNSQGAAASSYGGAADALARNAARTGNAAGMVAGEDALAQQKANTMSNVAAGNQIQFANQAKKDVQEGLQGVQGMYGMDTNLLARSLGIPVEYLNSYIGTGKMPTDFWSTLGENMVTGGMTGLAGALT